MIRLLVVIAVIFALGAGAAVWLHGETGYVLLSYAGWSIETSVIAFGLMLLALLLLMNYGLRLLAAALHLPRTMRGAYDARRRRLAQASFEKGLLDWFSARWNRAEVELVRRAADHESGGLNLLMAAEAAHHSGHRERRDHYLKLALDREDPQIRFAARLLLARIAIKDGDLEEARTRLLALREEAPKQTALVELLAEVYRRSGQWTALRALLTATERLKVFPAARLRALLVEASREGFDEAAAGGRLEDVKMLWAATPGALRGEPEIRNAYARALARLNADAEAAALITAALKHDWDAELVRLFASLKPPDSVGALAAVEQWLGQYGERPELLMAAAHACLENKLWGKARSYLEGAVRQHPNPVAYLELARLVERSPEGGDPDPIYREGLAAAAKALTGPQLPVLRTQT